MRQDQFDDLCDIALKKVRADVTDPTSVNSLIIDAIDLYLANHEMTKDGELDNAARIGSGSGAENNQDIFDDDDSPFYRYG
tara:strand:+ start:286 stop:528 length:243 start_codon:yes stop_codon:yes gene_type:complete